MKMFLIKTAALLLAAFSAPAFALDAPPPSAPPVAHKPALVPVQAGVNLMQNGDFEAVPGGQPEHWEKLPEGVSVIEDKTTQGHALRLDASKAVATSSGVLMRSEPVQAEPGRQYDIRLMARTSGLSAIVWVRAYGDFNGQERRLSDFKREIKFPKADTWSEFTDTFTVRQPVGAAALAVRGRPVPTPDRMRVELFCFGGDAGAVDFDSIKLTAHEAPAPTPAPTPLPTPYVAPTPNPKPADDAQTTATAQQ